MNSCVLVTGGSGVIGLALVKHFLARGHLVVATYASPQGRDKISELNKDGTHKRTLFPVQADFNASNTLEIIAEHLRSNSLTPMHLINNARSLTSLATDEKGRGARGHFQQEYHMAVIFPYLLTNLVLDMGKLCTVVHVSSMYGVVAPTPALYGGSLVTSPIQYGVAKAAQIHLAKEQSVRLAPFGVRVNAVSFGGITGRESEEFSLRYNTLAPLGRMLDLSDVVGAVEFLVSDASKGMTGHNLIVDGGWTTW